MSKKQLTDSERKRRQKFIVLAAAIGWLILILLGANLINSTFAIFRESGAEYSSAVHVAKNMTFPGNETKLALATSYFNFELILILLGIFVGLAVIYIGVVMGVPGLGEFWRLHKNRPTLEERVKWIELRIGTTGPIKPQEEKRETSGKK